ncbi:GRAM domain-containing protein [Pedobacter gandavensis]|uniref:GRAM domain-containing protein n=1 Tax=Pedobacter gandavensis TaxID=2679963 RepID=A0ABR6F1M5_9SPHI|nr:GRAM domain-containing protein [Pedobacter gandavensis]MBB2151429.1 hypothetical protein [Pedobacter gandavensis]
MTNFKKSILAGLVFGLGIGLYLTIKENWVLALVVGLFSGVVFSISSYMKLFSKMDNESSSFQKIDKNSIIYSGLANHYKDGISVGGKLYLSNNQLIFRSNIFSFIKRHESIIVLSEIVAVNFDDSFAPLRNGLSIVTSKRSEKFIVYKRGFWAEQIAKCKAIIYN